MVEDVTSGAPTILLRRPERAFFETQLLVKRRFYRNKATYVDFCDISVKILCEINKKQKSNHIRDRRGGHMAIGQNS